MIVSYAGRAASVAALAFAGALFGAGAAPGEAAAQSVATGGDVACLWRELPTVTKARIELAARRGRRTPISVINRFAGGELSALWARCGFEDSVQTLELTGQYWLAAAAEAVLVERLRLAAVSPGVVIGGLGLRAPKSIRAALGSELAARLPGRARPLMLDLLETLDRGRVANGVDPLSEAQKRLVIEYAATWLIREGLESAAEPFEGPPPVVADREREDARSPFDETGEAELGGGAADEAP